MSKMQTFICENPLTATGETDYSPIAQALDNKRLHKQALECWQILMNLTGLDPQGNNRVSKGWSNHPAVKMWRGYEFELADYGVAMVAEWIDRGYKSTLADKIRTTRAQAAFLSRVGLDVPEWITSQDTLSKVITTHRQALLVKDYEHYSCLGWAEDTGTKQDTYDYFWPI